MGIASFYGFVLVLKEQVIIALLGVEATITGFFGLIFVNALASFRGTFDMLERGWNKNDEKIQKVKESPNNKETYEYEKTVNEGSNYAQVWWEAIDATNKNKTTLVKHSVVTGILLVSSLLSAILALAVTFEKLVFFFSYLSIGLLLFGCLSQIFWLINDLGKDPAKNWSQAIINPNIHKPEPKS
jgi:hypothetical protein